MEEYFFSVILSRCLDQDNQREKIQFKKEENKDIWLKQNFSQDLIEKEKSDLVIARNEAIQKTML